MPPNTEQFRPDPVRRSESSLVLLLVSVFVLFSGAVPLSGAATAAASRADFAQVSASPKATLAADVARAQPASAWLGGTDAPDLAAGPTIHRHGPAVRPLLVAAEPPRTAARPLRLSPLAPRAPPHLG